MITPSEGEGEKCPSLNDSESCNAETCPGMGYTRSSENGGSFDYDENLKVLIPTTETQLAVSS